MSRVTNRRSTDNLSSALPIPSISRIKLFQLLLLITLLVGVLISLCTIDQQSMQPFPQAELDISETFNDANQRLIKSEIVKSAHVNCGNESTVLDCVRLYDISDIILSCQVTSNDSYLIEKMKKDLMKKHKASEDICSNKQNEFTGSGAWCLKKGNIEIHTNLGSFYIPQYHVVASKRIVKELIEMIKNENIRSINDFGAGVGQYKYSVLNEVHSHDLVYSAYDGAGNIEEYTHKFVKFFDLTLPIALPRADWVLSLEVGEHVPSGFEGMMLRNLHYHNCRGIILSWGVLGQGGQGHINNHSSNYLVSVMGLLGYTSDVELGKKFRNRNENYAWFRKSIFVFRRNVPVC